jgi:RNA polymerase sigma-70 factor, ECF subfamily
MYEGDRLRVRRPRSRDIAPVTARWLERRRKGRLRPPFSGAPEGIRMSQPAENWDLERYRDYLMILARTKIPHHLRHRLDPADVVQETLLHACRDQRESRAKSDAERTCWLRRILICRLVDELRRLNGPGAAVSLEHELDRSSARLVSFLAADQSTPSMQLHREELAVELSRRLAQLTEAQAEAVHLRHCEGWSVEQIGRHMGRTPVAVGGLLRHGLNKLRDIMRQESGPS